MAETSSGGALQKKFPELAGKVIPVLRDSQVKFRKPASKAITESPSVSDEAFARFREQFEKKGRSSISVNVEVRDAEDVVTCAGVFNWFVQRIEQQGSVVNHAGKFSLQYFSPMKRQIQIKNLLLIQPEVAAARFL